MKQTIRQVLDDMKDSQINLGSFAARETMAKLITTALKSKGNYTEFQTGESYSNINDKGEIDDDAIGGRVEFEEPETKHFADGFHEGRWEDDVTMESLHNMSIPVDTEIQEEKQEMSKFDEIIAACP